MNHEFWKGKLQFFIVEHPTFEGSDPKEEIYTPRIGLKIRFWFEGNLQIEGKFKEIDINFNSHDLLILTKSDSESSNTYRIPWERLISFELITGNEASKKLKDLIRMN